MTFGERLREQRERQKISLHTIAHATNISVRFLDAIEKNQFDKLPGGIFTRGFLRSYAIQVGLDPDATVEQFLADVPGAKEDSGDDAQRTRDGAGLGGWIAAGLGVLAIIIVLVYLFTPERFERSASDDASPPGRGDRSPSRPPPMGSLASSGKDRSPSGPRPMNPTASSSAQGQPAAGRDRPPSGPSPAVAPAAALQLLIMPTARCWVQVHADGQVRLAREVTAGERVFIDASERLQIVVGDAGAFRYELNGQSGRLLGKNGEVVRVSIQPTTVAQFHAAAR